MSRNATPGTTTYAPADVTTLNPDQYSWVGASWNDSQLAIPVAFNVLGMYRYSTYNVPNENQCVAAQTQVLVFNNDGTCGYKLGNFASDFLSQANANGTGLSKGFGLIKPYSITAMGSQKHPAQYCSLPSGWTGAPNGSAFVSVNSVTGSCASPNATLYSGVSVAALPAPGAAGSTGPWACGDKVLLMNPTGQMVNGQWVQANSTRSVQDTCPACSGGYGAGTNWPAEVGHIDAFNTSSASCSPRTFPDYGNYFSLRLR